MRSALPFVVLYDTEFILDTNAIDCYHKFDHQPRRGKPRRESRVDREERLVFVRRLPANRPFTGGFLMSGFFAGARYPFFERMLPFCRKKAGSLRFSVIDGLILRKIRA